MGNRLWFGGRKIIFFGFIPKQIHYPCFIFHVYFKKETLWLKELVYISAF